MLGADLDCGQWAVLGFESLREGDGKVPCGRKRKLKKIATHKRKKKKRKNRHKTR